MAYMSEEGYKKLMAELKELETVERPKISAAIAEARDKGDLSENAEYDAAKDEQRDFEARIEELEKILKNAEVFVEEEADLDKVSIGCQVKILDCEFDEELTYKIVGSTEANSLKGKISNESPVGKALLGKKIGDTVTVVKLHGEGAVKRRIMDMGITRGTEVHVRKVAPLGDPVEVTVRGYELSLRKADAEMIEVQ